MPSTAIQRFSYDPQTSVLFVTFVDGETYAYFDAPERLYQDFRAARSKGGFFAREVRNRYRYRRLDDVEAVSGLAGLASPPPAAGARSA